MWGIAANAMGGKDWPSVAAFSNIEGERPVVLDDSSALVEHLSARQELLAQDGACSQPHRCIDSTERRATSPMKLKSLSPSASAATLATAARQRIKPVDEKGAATEKARCAPSLASRARHLADCSELKVSSAARARSIEHNSVQSRPPHPSAVVSKLVTCGLACDDASWPPAYLAPKSRKVDEDLRKHLTAERNCARIELHQAQRYCAKTLAEWQVIVLDLESEQQRRCAEVEACSEERQRRLALEAEVCSEERQRRLALESEMSAMVAGELLEKERERRLALEEDMAARAGDEILDRDERQSLALVAEMETALGSELVDTQECLLDTLQRLRSELYSFRQNMNSEVAEAKAQCLTEVGKLRQELAKTSHSGRQPPVRTSQLLTSSSPTSRQTPPSSPETLSLLARTKRNASPGHRSALEVAPRNARQRSPIRSRRSSPKRNVYASSLDKEHSSPERSISPSRRAWKPAGVWRPAGPGSQTSPSRREYWP